MGPGMDGIFTSSPVQEEGEFLEKLRQLVCGRMPDYLWVDNKASQYRNWRIQKLYLEGEIFERDTAFTYGGWTLVVHKGSKTQKQENGVTLQGGFSFRKGEFFFSGESLLMDDKGRFLFDIIMSDDRRLSAEIRYFTQGWDTFLRRWGELEVKGEVFKLPPGVELQVCFSPLVQEETEFLLKKALEVRSGFTSVYGGELLLKLPAEFPLVFQRVVGVEKECYLAPGGRAVGCGVKEMQLGLSGTEYAALPEEAALCFVPGQPAWYGAGRMKGQGQTVYLAMPDALYYSQSSEAPFFYSDKNGFCRHARLPAFVLSQKSALPIFPFSGCPASSAAAAQMIEQKCLGGIRRKTVEGQLKYGRIAEDGEGRLLKSRCGMAVWLESGEVEWVSLACVGRPLPDLAFTRPGRRMMASVQTNDLFLVLCSSEQIAGLAGTPCSITKESLERAERGGYPYVEQVKGLKGTTFLSLDEFCRAVRECTKESRISETFLYACDHFTVEMEGWTFRMGARWWGEEDCLFLVKRGTASSVLELMKEPMRWGLAPDERQISLAQGAVCRAKERAEELEDSGLLQILTDSKWQGCVFFHVPVDVKNLPPEIDFLAGGLDTGRMRALYVASSVSASWRALIDYRDTEHQYYPDMREFGFKVLELRAELENGKTKRFSASAELLMNRIFGGRLQAGEDSDAGNNLAFDGYYQKEESGGHYLFRLRQEQDYGVSGCALSRLLVKGGALQANGRKGRFVLFGDMAFDDTDKTDIFSYDRIGYQGLAIDMEVGGGENHFTVDVESLRFNLSEASVRENSFARRFPLIPTGIGYVKGRTPTDAGYAPLKVYREASEVEEEWYGIFWRIALGNMGNLAAKSSLALELLTAWKPYLEEEVKEADGSFSCGRPKYFTGIRLLANGNAVGWEIPLEGVLTLGFEGIELKMRETEETGGTEYYFRFRNFALRFLGLRFPQSNNDMYLIADENQTLGWYGSAGEGR